MRGQGALYSALFHLSLLILAYLGLPDWFDRDSEPQPLVITLETLPIKDKTNIKPSDKPVVKPRDEKPAPAEALEAKKEPPASKPKSEPEKAPDPVPVKEKPKPKPEKPKEEKPKEEKPKDKPKEEKPKEKPKPEVDELDEVLKNLRKDAREGEEKEKPKQPAAPAPNPTKSAAPYDPTVPLSLSERDAINSQFVQCWNIPAGSKDDYTLKVSIDVNLKQDASVATATLAPEQRGRYASDTVFRAAADSAIRAVHKCSPLKNLPADKYNSWKELRLNFDPSMQLY